MTVGNAELLCGANDGAADVTAGADANIRLKRLMMRSDSIDEENRRNTVLMLRRMFFAVNLR